MHGKDRVAVIEAIVEKIQFNKIVENESETLF